MNLHAIVSGAIGSVNPNVPATIQISTGYVTAPDGSRVPTYATVAAVAQVQALSFRDLTAIDGLNLNGTRRAIYLFGKFDGVVRPSEKGGDLITLTGGANAGVWLTAMVLEQWSDGEPAAWCKVACTLQNDSLS